jgi:acyl-CoA thioester hydrolase
VKFVVDVAARWSDMDAYGHVNHASMVTLLEEARAELFFHEAPHRGVGLFNDGIVVSRLTVEYLAPLVYQGSPVRIEIWVSQLKTASFVLGYAVSSRGNARVLARAETTMVPYDLINSRPRRLTAQESHFLALWTPDEPQRRPSIRTADAGA